MKNSAINNLLRTAAIMLTLFSLFLTACGGNTTANPDASAEPTDMPSETAIPSPASGGTLSLPMPENISVNNPDYSPLLVYTEEMLQLFSLVYDPLIAVDESNMLVPSLAQSWTQDPENENAWLVTLRKEVRWHSGEPLTADDVVYTYSTLYILGSESYYASSLNNIERVEKVDDLTLRFHMNSAGLTALYALNFPVIKENSDRLVGTGAYKAGSVSDEVIRLNVNNDWWDRPPYIQTIEFLARPTNDTALASYSAGQLNFVPTAQLAVGKYSEPGVTVVKDMMTQNMEVLLVNHRRLVMNQANLRRAIIHAINRSQIITNIYMNRARSSDVPFPPDSWLYDSNATQFNYNVQTASTLLDGMGYALNGDGMRSITLTLLTSSTTENTTRAEAAQLIASQLEQVGITVNIVTASHTYGDTQSEFLLALEAGDWDIALAGFNLNQNNDLSPYLTQDGKNNYGNYLGGSMNRLIENMRDAADEESLRECAYKFQQAFTEELPFIVLYFRLNSVVYSADLKGVDVMREPLLMRNIKGWYLRTE